MIKLEKTTGYFITEYIDNVPGMLVGVGDDKESAIGDFVEKVEIARNKCMKNMDRLNEILDEIKTI